jgi:hypothetical protein
MTRTASCRCRRRCVTGLPPMAWLPSSTTPSRRSISPLSSQPTTSRGACRPAAGRAGFSPDERSAAGRLLGERSRDLPERLDVPGCVVFRPKLPFRLLRRVDRPLSQAWRRDYGRRLLAGGLPGPLGVSGNFFVPLADSRALRLGRSLVFGQVGAWCRQVVDDARIA